MITAAHWATAYLISEWLVRVVMLLYVPQRRPPAAARTWLLILFLIPWPGLLLYWAFGRVQLPRRRRTMHEVAVRQIRAARSRMEHRGYVVEPDLPDHLRGVVRLATKLSDLEPFAGNAVELLDDYAGAIDRLVADVDAARHHAHLLFFIFADDAVGTRVADALARAAGRGVRARLLVDAVGSRGFLRRAAPDLARRGVEVRAAMRVGLLRRGAARFDLRNHRKVAVFDGRVGYTGSQNVVDGHFVRGRPNRELSVRFEGPVVSQLQAVFLSDWYLETGHGPDEGELFPHLPPSGPAVCQVVPDGPGFPDENVRALVVAILHAAAERVVIATPYFIPDEPLLQAMRSAVLRGVDVRLVVSRWSNHAVTEFAQQSFYDEVLTAGVRVHRYVPHFLHAKHVSADGRLIVVGTSNMDIRSFRLNAEVVAVVYDPAAAARLREIEEQYLADSEEVTAEAWARRPTLRRLAQNVARLADALL